MNDSDIDAAIDHLFDDAYEATTFTPPHAPREDDDDLELDLPSAWAREPARCAEADSVVRRGLGHLVWIVTHDRDAAVPDSVVDASGRRWSLVDVGRFVDP